MDWISWSSALNGAARRSVSPRTPQIGFHQILGEGSLNRRKVTKWGWQATLRILISSQVSPMSGENVGPANWFPTGVRPR